jgi:hypothetical protein
MRGQDVDRCWDKDPENRKKFSPITFFNGPGDGAIPPSLPPTQAMVATVTPPPKVAKVPKVAIRYSEVWEWLDVQAPGIGSTPELGDVSILSHF